MGEKYFGALSLTLIGKGSAAEFKTKFFKVQNSTNLTLVSRISWKD